MSPSPGKRIVISQPGAAAGSSQPGKGSRLLMPHVFSVNLVLQKWIQSHYREYVCAAVSGHLAVIWLKASHVLTADSSNYVVVPSHKSLYEVLLKHSASQNTAVIYFQERSVGHLLAFVNLTPELEGVRKGYVPLPWRNMRLNVFSYLKLELLMQNYRFTDKRCVFWLS